MVAIVILRLNYEEHGLWEEGFSSFTDRKRYGGYPMSYVVCALKLFIGVIIRVLRHPLGILPI